MSSTKSIRIAIAMVFMSLFFSTFSQAALRLEIFDNVDIESSINKIRQDYQDGLLSLDEYVLYDAYIHMAPDKLPEEYRILEDPALGYTAADTGSLYYPSTEYLDDISARSESCSYLTKTLVKALVEEAGRKETLPITEILNPEVVEFGGAPPPEMEVRVAFRLPDSYDGRYAICGDLLPSETITREMSPALCPSSGAPVFMTYNMICITDNFAIFHYHMDPDPLLTISTFCDNNLENLKRQPWEGMDAVVTLEDARELVISTLENAWELLVDEHGYKAPNKDQAYRGSDFFQVEFLRLLTPLGSTNLCNYVSSLCSIDYSTLTPSVLVHEFFHQLQDASNNETPFIQRNTFAQGVAYKLGSSRDWAFRQFFSSYTSNHDEYLWDSTLTDFLYYGAPLFFEYMNRNTTDPSESSVEFIRDIYNTSIPITSNLDYEQFHSFFSFLVDRYTDWPSFQSMYNDFVLDTLLYKYGDSEKLYSFTSFFDSDDSLGGPVGGTSISKDGTSKRTSTQVVGFDDLPAGDLNISFSGDNEGEWQVTAIWVDQDPDSDGAGTITPFIGEEDVIPLVQNGDQQSIQGSLKKSTAKPGSSDIYPRLVVVISNAGGQDAEYSLSVVPEANRLIHGSIVDLNTHKLLDTETYIVDVFATSTAGTPVSTSNITDGYFSFEPAADDDYIVRVSDPAGVYATYTTDILAVGPPPGDNSHVLRIPLRNATSTADTVVRLRGDFNTCLPTSSLVYPEVSLKITNDATGSVEKTFDIKYASIFDTGDFELAPGTYTVSIDKDRETLAIAAGTVSISREYHFDVPKMHDFTWENPVLYQDTDGVVLDPLRFRINSCYVDSITAFVSNSRFLGTGSFNMLALIHEVLPGTGTFEWYGEVTNLDGSNPRQLSTTQPLYFRFDGLQGTNIVASLNPYGSDDNFGGWVFRRSYDGIEIPMSSYSFWPQISLFIERATDGSRIRDLFPELSIPSAFSTLPVISPWDGLADDGTIAPAGSYRLVMQNTTDGTRLGTYAFTMPAVGPDLPSIRNLTLDPSGLLHYDLSENAVTFINICSSPIEPCEVVIPDLSPGQPGKSYTLPLDNSSNTYAHYVRKNAVLEHKIDLDSFTSGTQVNIIVYAYNISGQKTLSLSYTVPPRGNIKGLALLSDTNEYQNGNTEVTLISNGTEITSTRTDPLGAYTFKDVTQDGHYTLQFSHSGYYDSSLREVSISGNIDNEIPTVLLEPVSASKTVLTAEPWNQGAIIYWNVPYSADYRRTRIFLGMTELTSNVLISDKNLSLCENRLRTLFGAHYSMDIDAFHGFPTGCAFVSGLINSLSTELTVVRERWDGTRIAWYGGSDAPTATTTPGLPPEVEAVSPDDEASTNQSNPLGATVVCHQPVPGNDLIDSLSLRVFIPDLNEMLNPVSLLVSTAGSGFESWITRYISELPEGPHVLLFSVHNTEAVPVRRMRAWRIIVDRTPPVITEMIPSHGDYTTSTPSLSARILDQDYGYISNIIARITGSNINNTMIQEWRSFEGYNYSRGTGLLTLTEDPSSPHNLLVPLTGSEATFTLTASDRAGNTATKFVQFKPVSTQNWLESNRANDNVTSAATSVEPPLTLMWKRDIGTVLWEDSSPIIADNKPLIVQSDHLYAFDPDNGNLVWKDGTWTASSERFNEAGPLADIHSPGDKIVIDGPVTPSFAQSTNDVTPETRWMFAYSKTNQAVYMLRPETGDIIWEFLLPGSEILAAGLTTSYTGCLGAGYHVIIPDKISSRLIGIHQSGQLLWQADVNTLANAKPVVVSKPDIPQVLQIVYPDDDLNFYDPDIVCQAGSGYSIGDTIPPDHAFSSPHGNSFFGNTPLFLDENYDAWIFAIDLGGYVYAVRPDGSLFWEENIGSYNPFAAPAVYPLGNGAVGVIYAGRSSDERLTAFYSYIHSGSPTTNCEDDTGALVTCPQQVAWSRNLPTFTLSAPVVARNEYEEPGSDFTESRIFLFLHNGNFYGIRDDGTEEWVYGTQGVGDFGLFIPRGNRAVPAVNTGRLFVTTGTGQLLALAEGARFKDGWNLASVPVDQATESDREARWTFFDDYPVGSITERTLFDNRLESGVNVWLPLNETSIINNNQLFHGYAVKFPAATVLDGRGGFLGLDGSGDPIVVESSSDGPAETGWRLIRNPFSFNITFGDETFRIDDNPTSNPSDPCFTGSGGCPVSEAVTANYMSDTLFTLRNTDSGISFAPAMSLDDLEEERQMEPFRAYWVYFPRSVPISLKGIPSRVQIPFGWFDEAWPQLVPSLDWELPLAAECNRFRDSGAVIGQRPDTSDGEDSHDLKHEPELPSDFISVTIDNRWEDKLVELRHDIRLHDPQNPEAQEVWDVIVTTDFENYPAQFMWGDPQETELATTMHNYELLLFDCGILPNDVCSQAPSADMRGKTAYRFYTGSIPDGEEYIRRRFRVVLRDVTPPSVSGLHISLKNIDAQNAQLTAFSASLSEAAQVSMQIYGPQSQGFPLTGDFSSPFFRDAGPAVFTWTGYNQENNPAVPGVYKLKLTGTDMVGNQAQPIELLFDVIIDETPPAISDLEISFDPYSPNGFNTTQQVSFTLSEDSKITAALYYAPDSTLRTQVDLIWDNADTSAGPGSLQWQGGSHGSLAAGAYEFEFRAQDMAGNSSATETIGFTIDNLAPEITVLSSDTDVLPVNTSDTMPLILFTVWDETEVLWEMLEVSIDEAGLAVDERDGTIVTVRPESPLETGVTHDVSIRAWDIVGNMGEYSFQIFITDDPPAFTGVKALPATITRNNMSAILQFQISKPCSLTALLRADSDGSIARTLASGKSIFAGSNQMVWDGAGDLGQTLPTGGYTCSLECIESQSQAAATASVSITLTDLPHITLLDAPEAFSPNGDGSGDGAEIEFTTADAAGIITLKIFDAAGNLAATLIDSAVMSPGSYSETWTGATNVGPASEGIYKVRLETSDLNNRIKEIAETTLIVDLSAPQVHEFSAAPNPFSPDFNGIDDLSEIHAAISDQSGFSVRMSIDCSSANPLCLSQYPTSLLTRTWDMAGSSEIAPHLISLSWNGIAPTGKIVPDGEYIVSLNTQDRAGNTISDTLSLHKDNPPVITLQEHTQAFSPNDDARKDTAIVIWTADDEGVFRLTVLNEQGSEVAIAEQDIDNIGNVSASMRAEWNGMQSDGSPAPEGVYTLVVSGHDANSVSLNPCKPVSVQTTLDVTPPDIQPFYPLGNEFTWLQPKLKADLSDDLSGFRISEGEPEDITFHIAPEDITLPVTAKNMDQEFMSLRAEARPGTALPEGPHYLTIRAEDAAGNTVVSPPIRFVSIQPFSDEFESSGDPDQALWDVIPVTHGLPVAPPVIAIDAGSLVLSHEHSQQDNGQLPIDMYGATILGKGVYDVSRQEVVIQASQVTESGLDGTIHGAGIFMSEATADPGAKRLYLMRSGVSILAFFEGVSADQHGWLAYYELEQDEPADLMINYEEGVARFFVNGLMIREVSLSFHYAMTGIVALSGFDGAQASHSVITVGISGFHTYFGRPVLDAVTLENIARPDARDLVFHAEQFLLQAAGTPWQTNAQGWVYNPVPIAQVGSVQYNLDKLSVAGPIPLSETAPGSGIYESAAVMLESRLDGLGNTADIISPIAINDWFELVPFKDSNYTINRLSDLTFTDSAVVLKNASQPDSSSVSVGDSVRVVITALPGASFDAYLVNPDNLGAPAAGYLIGGKLVPVYSGNNQYTVDSMIVTNWDRSGATLSEISAIVMPPNTPAQFFMPDNNLSLVPLVSLSGTTLPESIIRYQEPLFLYEITNEQPEDISGSIFGIISDNEFHIENPADYSFSDLIDPLLSSETRNRTIQLDAITEDPGSYNILLYFHPAGGSVSERHLVSVITVGDCE